MNEKQIEKVKFSKGYKVLFEALNEFFTEKYEVKGIIYDEDLTSVDFRLIIDFPNLKGVDIGVSGSGSRQMFRVGGNGNIGIAVPKEDEHGILPSGLKGNGLGYILKNNDIVFGARVDSPEKIYNYFMLFKNYYNKYYC